METLNQNWQTVSEIELIYKTKVRASERPQIKSSRDAYHLALSAWDSNKIEFFEQFKVLLMNNAHKALGIYEISSGGVTGTVVDLRLIFSAALKANATSLMMIHNHPSGNLTASEADKQVTRRVKEVGRLLDITLIDSLIITTESYYSFADEGAL
ncbi:MULTISPECIES: JAB domain-containing protein [unclassified Flavobacterium]|uniref:JAB domain-containing protein n=1 Tax=unclassified Flavobacterium TaxID=196869 RepID=UPI00057C75B9|nr:MULTISPECIES: JAB domain-containing protein [unclassified Flavobacterium]KIA95628.1 DNA repair protein [Flavobacterium sp. KMS]OUL63454.1 DNA repair protein [Flavobacterium sp. AJR]